MKIAELLHEGEGVLARSEIEQAEIDAWLLLGHCLNMRRTELFLHGDNKVEGRVCRLFRRYIARRATREPVAYILQEKEFWSLPFYINSKVLIPRPETEFLIETVLTRTDGSSRPIKQGLDLCCGSGVIAVVLALELQAHILALDCSLEALKVTEQNARKHNVAGQVTTVRSDLFSALTQKQTFPLIVSNPPYVSCTEIEEDLQPEVADFEPRLALDGGSDGLVQIRRIAADILLHLEPAGMFFMEFGAGQGEKVYREFSTVRYKDRYFEEVEITKDYSGRDRVLYAKANTENN